MKKRTQSILNNPLRYLSGNGPGTDSSSQLSVESPEGDVEDLMLFRCGAIGGTACAWEARAKSADQLVAEIEQHLHEAHQRELDEAERVQIRRFCQSDRAA